MSNVYIRCFGAESAAEVKDIAGVSETDMFPLPRYLTTPFAAGSPLQAPKPVVADHLGEWLEEVDLEHTYNPRKFSQHRFGNGVAIVKHTAFVLVNSEFTIAQGYLLPMGTYRHAFVSHDLVRNRDDNPEPTQNELVLQRKFDDWNTVAGIVSHIARRKRPMQRTYIDSNLLGTSVHTRNVDSERQLFEFLANSAIDALWPLEQSYEPDALPKDMQL